MTGERQRGQSSRTASGNAPLRVTGSDCGEASVRSWFNTTAACARHEWRQLVYSPLTLIFQVWFLFALALSIFVVADFYSTDLATANLQWTFLPWIALVMAPALAMRAFAESAGDRALELTLSLPVPVSALVAGKWLAGSAVLILTLAFTAPFAATIGYLGSPDWGSMATGYLGAGLMLASYYAVALLAASLTRDQIGAYVCGLGGLSILLLLGWDVAARALEGTGMASLMANASQLSPKYWLDRMAEGRVELAAIAYFALVIVMSIAACAWFVERRRRPRETAGAFVERLRDVVIGTIGFACALALIGAATLLPGTLDATAEQEFTLHPQTREIARTAPDGLTVDFYYSLDESRIPASIRLHARRTENLLREMAGLSGGNISLQVHRTEPDGESAEAAQAAGVQRIAMTSGDSFMLGAVLRRADRQGVISYFDERRAQLLEYDVALALFSLGREKIPRVGILSPLLRSSNTEEPRAGFAILEEIKRQYDVAIIPHFADKLPEGLDALIVIDAPILKPSMLYAIDQHLMSGRGLIAMLDPYPRFNRANMMISPEPSEAVNDISDLLARYGARYLGGQVVGDPDLAAPVTGADQRQLSYPYWLRVRPNSMAGNHTVTASLNELLFAEAGAFELAGRGASGEGDAQGAGEAGSAAGSSIIALVRTGPKSGLQPRDSFKDTTADASAANFKTDDGGSRVIAGALAGPFESAFESAPIESPESEPATSPEGEPQSKPQSTPVERGPHLRATQSAALFVIGDADWLFDPMALQDVTVAEQTYSRPLNDNAAFILNMIEYATGDSRLIGIRSRGQVQRQFTRVADMLRDAQQTYRAQEADFVGRIAAVESTIAQVLQKTGAKSAEQLPDELRNQIKDLRGKLLPFRRELREIRRTMREEVERLGARLTLINLVGGPLLALGFASAMWRLRRRRGARATG